MFFLALALLAPPQPAIGDVCVATPKNGIVQWKHHVEGQPPSRDTLCATLWDNDDHREWTVQIARYNKPAVFASREEAVAYLVSQPYEDPAKQ